MTRLYSPLSTRLAIPRSESDEWPRDASCAAPVSRRCRHPLQPCTPRQATATQAIDRHLNQNEKTANMTHHSLPLGNSSHGHELVNSGIDTAECPVMPGPVRDQGQR